MATPTIAGHTVITPDLSKPEIGQPTVVAFFGGDHTVKLSLAHVLAIGPVDPVTGHPTLTVAYPSQPADPRKLGTPRWSDAFDRVTGVQHYSHPDAKDGKLSIAWGGDGDIEVENVPELPTPAGDGANPVYQRQDLEVPNLAAATNAEAIIAQRGQAPEGSHLSPATSEAGTTHDATVAPAAPDATGNAPVAPEIEVKDATGNIVHAHETAEGVFEVDQPASAQTSNSQ